MTIKGFCLLSGPRFSKMGKEVVALAWFQGSRYRKCPARNAIPADDTWTHGKGREFREQLRIGGLVLGWG